MPERVICIRHDDRTTVEEIREPIWQSITALIDGYMEIVPIPRLGKDYRMVVDDCGKLWGKPVNRLASMIYNNPHDTIVGTALIMREGIRDGEPDIIGLSDDEIRSFLPEWGGDNNG